ncbi:hypothetical protein [Candidatus Entotheonella palauensis]|uniref:hypothetical protein n=1 Tax=Candidatus Entotheonella palauensis TaxID=93172 RepID=UPI000B7F4FC0|nr:hypothetical protein [Candidatus Entotheonella palauensis]
MHVTPFLQPMRYALLPIVGQTGYRRLLSAMYDPALLWAAHAPAEIIRALGVFCRSNDIEAIPRREQVLDSDSKSRIYVVHTEFDGQASWPLVLKCYHGSRQQTAPIEARMSVYFKQCLAPLRTVIPILDVVSLTNAGDRALSVALLPYAGRETLYDRLHQLPPHTTQVETLVQQACETLAYTQVTGRAGHEAHDIHLTQLSPKTAAGYFLNQIRSALITPFARGGTPLEMGDDLLKQFAFFANLLGEDSSAAGLYYRGINPRNVMLVDASQAEIDFEQDSLRSRFIDIVSLLENGMEMAEWDATADYQAYTGQTDFDAWNRERQRALTALDTYNYLSHPQVEQMTRAFIDTTCHLEQQYNLSVPASYDEPRYRLLLETARLFRHLQYVGYCKRNELQTANAVKRISSRYRQHFHALWAKVALDNLLFPPCSQAPELPESEFPSAMALRRTLDQLPLDVSPMS